jgi:hypothetical protein
MKTKKNKEKEPENNKSREVWLDDTTLSEVAKNSEEERNDESNEEKNDN